MSARCQSIARAALASALLAAAGLTPFPAGASGLPGGRALAPSTRFYVPPPAAGAMQQARDLWRSGDESDARLILSMESVPQAVWLTGETSAQSSQGARGSLQADRQVERDVRRTMRAAARQHAVPVLVAYNIPGRDCSQYSAGGAPSDAAYAQWIASLTRGLRAGQAVIILEPDALANLPSACGAAYQAANPQITDATREADVASAVAVLEKDPNASVYIDAGHSAWQSVGTIAQRLIAAGVQEAQGFFLNVSNYQYAGNNVAYGTWVSDCIAYGTVVNPDDGNLAADCPNQYWNGGPATGWVGTALSAFGVWSATAASLDLDTSGLDSRYALLLGTVSPMTHFVIDTSRDGRGPNDMQAYSAAPYEQPSDPLVVMTQGSYTWSQYAPTGVIATLAAGNWCNPPDSGTGILPTAGTRSVSPLLDAYLWVKTPGQSDGQCDAAGGVRAWDDSSYSPSIAGWPASSPPSSTYQTFDPLWSLQTRSVLADPAAGAWFPQQALQLAADANPALPRDQDTDGPRRERRAR
jgi:endoglucanase